MGKLVAGVGINDADYPVVRFGKDVTGKRNREWVCPFYKTWTAMLNRCYREPILKAYKDTTVCEEWHTFSNFKSWMETQDWEGKELDKDLLTDNNQYSPQNCIFISGWLNAYLVGGKPDHPTHLPGISYNKVTGAYLVNLHTKIHDLRSSQRFVDINSAINYYYKHRLTFALSKELDTTTNILVEDYFNRKLKTYLKVVKDNPELFPTREKPISSPNLPICGERYVTKKGYWYVIVSIINSEEITIRFDDGEEKVVSNVCIKRGHIKKNVIKDTKPMIKSRIDKFFKWNNHGIISGIQPCGSGYYVVSYTEGKTRKCFYSKDIRVALDFRKNMLIGRVSSIVGSDIEHLEYAMDYFLGRWRTEVLEYSGNLPVDV